MLIYKIVYVQLAKAALAKFLTLFKETFHSWQGCDEVLSELCTSFAQ